MDNKLKLFGQQVAYIRTAKHITQEQLAEKVGYSTNHISKLESARTNPSFDLIIKIAQALNINEKELFNYSKDEEKSEIARKIFYEVQELDKKKQEFIYSTIKNIKGL